MPPKVAPRCSPRRSGSRQSRAGAAAILLSNGTRRLLQFRSSEACWRGDNMKSAIRALAILAASGVFVATADAADKVRFQTDWLPSGEHAMYYGAWQKGIFAEEGIDVTITRGYGSGDTLTKLAGGAFGFGGAGGASRPAGPGRPKVAGEKHVGA